MESQVLRLYTDAVMNSQAFIIPVFSLEKLFTLLADIHANAFSIF